MRALIDGIEQELKNRIELNGVKIESYGPKYVIPESVPYINIVPRSKERDRSFVIGTSTKLYRVHPEVEIHVIQSSMKSLRAAFDKCEDLAEDVLTYLSDISATTLNVDDHQSFIEDYDGDQWEMTFYYLAVIVLRADKDESYS